MDFRVVPAEAVDVGLEASTIEPAKHLVELRPEDEANDRKRQSLKFHFLAEHAAVLRPREGEHRSCSESSLASDRVYRLRSYPLAYRSESRSQLGQSRLGIHSNPCADVDRLADFCIAQGLDHGNWIPQ
jgi:hypothetical protein